MTEQEAIDAILKQYKNPLYRWAIRAAQVIRIPWDITKPQSLGYSFFAWQYGHSHGLQFYDEVRHDR